ncbi:hybrid sensor histidine kinase/response regulator [Gloeothece verrucosa]|uniref:histidine kinase n=1 Tax=Gloeothece verrucosa (strain PCC 7822) TaxID=497965 RepID=E0U5M1_GLOV7|nr:hybrid sensor histidine kinase/response regulator [Gloeothece verrucosa]ADN14734.1 CheA signal transduction histidine kinase [Gloeothece verrucosa PCC 7822]
MDSGFDTSKFSMLDLFSIEVETQTEILTDKLLALENHLRQSQIPSDLNLILEALMRASHSIKGAARVVQIEVAVKIAHLMEDCFTTAMNGTIPLNLSQIDQLLQGVDFLQQLSKVREKNLENWLSQHQQQAENIINALVIAPVAPQEQKQLNPAPQQEISPAIIEAKAYPVSSTSEDAIVIDTVLSNEVETDELEPKVFSSLAPQREEDQSYLDLSSLFLDQETLPTAQQVKETLSSALSLISTAPPDKTRFVRVSSDNLNRLMGLAGEALVEAGFLNPFADSLLNLKKKQLELSQLLEKLDSVLSKTHLTVETETYLKAIQQKERECRETLGERLVILEQFAYRSLNLCDRLYREVIASHLRPFSEGVQGFPRMVRDIAKQLNKSVKLEIIGKGTLVDRDILKKLEAPLTQMLRNAIDHGIEFPDERAALLKPSQGTIRLEAAHRFGMLCITLADDGRGIDLEQIRQRVIDKQLVKPDLAQQLTDNELLEFIFLPGFSTSAAVTEISGRGVGLNIAKTMVEEVGGNLQATTKPGKGISFHFQLPLTLSVIRTLLVEISGEPYAFPLTRIEQVVMLNAHEIFSLENRQYFSLNLQNIGLVRADQVLELSPSKVPSEVLSIIILSDQFNRYGLIVDRFLGERNLVIRPLDTRLGKIQDISAAALLEDGSPVLILDVLDLMRSIDKLFSSSEIKQAQYDFENNILEKPKRILVVDDSITVREMERKLLENHGYQVDLAMDGMEGWNAVISGDYDLIITDVDMPRMNGIKLVAQIKKHHQLQKIPVIIISYKERQEDRLQGLEAGADYYLTKSSFHDDTFINAVVDLIGKA